MAYLRQLRRPNPPPMTKDGLIRQVVDTYRMLGPITPCSFVVGSFKKPQYEIVLRGPCHAMLQYWRPNFADYIITSYPIESKHDIRFFVFLRDVMFRQWADHFHLLATEDSKPYIEITGLDSIPANILYNFCIASRTPVELSSYMTNWANLVDAGLHPAFAYALFRSDTKPKYLHHKTTFLGNTSNHSPMYNTLDLSRLVNGTPQGCEASYRKSPHDCTPCNQIWGDTKDLRSLVDRSVLDFYEQWKQDHPNDEDLLQPGCGQ